MGIYGVYVISKSGGLIFNFDHYAPRIENEKSFTFPLDIVLDFDSKKVSVIFGQKDGINGHVLTSINGILVNGCFLEDGRSVKEVISKEENYPLNMRFTRLKMTTNEKIFLASMFYPLFAISSQLSPEVKSSGIHVLEADTFKLHCYQTLTGVKFIVISDISQVGMESLLQRVYDLYADYVIKNPFYSLEMPIRCEFFESNLQLLLEQMEKFGVVTI